MDRAAAIRQAVSMLDVAARYGYRPNRAGYVPCPFHAEDTPSLKLYPEDRGFHCFGCGRSGDVTDFVMGLFDLTFQQALFRLQHDFGLDIPSVPLNARDRNRVFARQLEVNIKMELDRQALVDYRELLFWLNRLHAMLWRTKHEFAPDGPEESFHPLYVYALRNLDYTEYLIDNLPWR